MDAFESLRMRYKLTFSLFLEKSDGLTLTNIFLEQAEVISWKERRKAKKYNRQRTYVPATVSESRIRNEPDNLVSCKRRSASCLFKDP